MDKRLKKIRIPISSRHSIEPEEIFFDSAKIKEFEESEVNVRKLESPISAFVFVAINIFEVLVLVFFLGYTSFLISKKGSDYTAQAQINSSRAVPAHAVRGLVYSSDGVLLAQNEMYFDIFIKVSEINIFAQKTKSDLVFILENIATALDLEPVDVHQSFRVAYEKRFSEFVLIRGVSRDDVARINEYIIDMPFVEIRQTQRRKFRGTPSLSHVIGYTSGVSQSDIGVGDYIRGERIGKTGIEAFYDENLRGETGLFVERIDSRGRVLGGELGRDPTPGKNITLHLVYSLQEKIYEILNKHAEALNINSAVAIVLDPRDGGVLSLVNIPGFEANLFEKGISQEEFNRLISDSSKPLFNRAIAGEYPSGSIIKPLIAAAALEEKIVSPNFLIYSDGVMEVPSVYNPEIVYEFKDWKIHGWTDMFKAIADSVNIYFYTIGGGYKDQPGLGIQKIEEYLKKFGWGASLGIDLPSERAGLIPNPKWKKEAKGENWYIGDTYHVAIGQGDILVTPMQVAAATAVFANRGILFSPRVVREIGNEEIPPKIIRKNFISRENLKIVKEGMRGAVEVGSSRYLASLPIGVAGKTGTAQTGKVRNHAWFSGFAPYENPEVVVTVLLEEGEKSEYAVRVAKEIFEAYLTYIAS